MARIRGFGGLRYNLERVNAADVMAPPYDVVDAAGREALAKRASDNCIHFILPEGEGDAKYTQAASDFRAIAKRAMVRDEAPSIYVYHQTFEVLGQRHVRKGFVCLVELTRFGQGPVLAHERTLAGPKIDRLNLMRACDAHLELVFGMFSDPEHKWGALLESDQGEPVLQSDFDGIGHALYRVSDPAALAALATHLEDRSIYIADGHHRYETMCAFRDELEQRGHQAPVYGMMYLSNLDDPGLVVLPTHRLVHGLASVDLASLLKSVEPFFDVTRGPVPANVDALRTELSAAGSERAAFGLSLPGSGEMVTLTLRADFSPKDAGLGEMAAALQYLDVALLHELVLERGLGITKAAQAAKANLRYYKSSQSALEIAKAGGDDTQLVCFMNATPVQDVRDVCDSGEVMPQKSTFFYPKIPNGLVFYDLSESQS